MIVDKTCIKTTEIILDVDDIKYILYEWASTVGFKTSINVDVITYPTLGAIISTKVATAEGSRDVSPEGLTMYLRTEGLT